MTPSIEDASGAYPDSCRVYWMAIVDPNTSMSTVPDLPTEITGWYDDVSNFYPGYGAEGYDIVNQTTDLFRHLFEAPFLFHLTGGTRNSAFSPFLEEKSEYVVIGFCLGIQTMNVAAGGTLSRVSPWMVTS